MQQLDLALQFQVATVTAVDLFERDRESGEWTAGVFVGRPFSLDYGRAQVLVSDAWKRRAKGVPQGAFLLAYYENDEDISEALLLRVLRPARLPASVDRTVSMVEYYRENPTGNDKGYYLDSYTQFDAGFSALECRILGTFYKDKTGRVRFGADVHNFYSAHYYSVIKPNAQTLEFIVNLREGENTGNNMDIRIGRVRYSSSGHFHATDDEVEVFVNPKDFLGHRTALFGMTRTGKSNTIKKIIQATMRMNAQAPRPLKRSSSQVEENLDPFTPYGVPKFPVGQIIFDINGEYANPNLQDDGTAIYELYQDQVSRYCTLPKEGFRIMKVNFYRDVLSGFELVRSHLAASQGTYIESLRAVDLTPPQNAGGDFSAMTRHQRKVAAYLCCLFKAGFPVPAGYTVQFPGNEKLNEFARQGGIDPSKGVTLEQATNWFYGVWDHYGRDEFFSKYKQKHGHEWADEDLKALLIFLTRKKVPGGNPSVDGYLKLRGIIDLHTEIEDRPFEEQIIADVRKGRVAIIDLSQGDPDIQALYSDRICRAIFADALDRFVHNQPNNFIQFYFEEAHNLFPRKEDRDLNGVYNKIAKEGAKLNLGLIYATQEVSSISANILKNTQNWFITHLNNEEEIKEIKKYYDFGDFADSLVHYSASSDRGFVRMKTYSNPFVVPVQVDLFGR